MSFEKIPDEFKITPYYSNSYLIDGELKEWKGFIKEHKLPWMNSSDTPEINKNAWNI